MLCLLQTARPTVAHPPPPSLAPPPSLPLPRPHSSNAMYADSYA